ncbi:MAG: hypothetical protein ACOX6V_01870 [Patescibacteria group bacterium]|jgi:hypothetical protein
MGCEWYHDIRLPSVEVNDREEVNILNFLKEYIDETDRPLRLLDHTGPVTYSSDSSFVDLRTAAQYFYLIRKPVSADYYWGRTVFAEKVFAELLKQEFSQFLNQNGIVLELAPDEMDHSSRAGYTEYQKGADMCLAWRKEDLDPICGIDVTVGKRNLVRRKRGRPGIQTRSAMGVIVFPLRDFVFGPGLQQDFLSYLDTHARNSVLRTGEYQPYYGLTAGEIELWRYITAEQFKEAISSCRLGLETSTERGVFTFPHLPYVLEQLEFMDSVISSYAQRISTTSS